MRVIASEILIIPLLVLANGVFAMSEIAIVSCRKNRLRKLAEQGDAGAQAALELAESPDRFLSTVQVGITLIGVLAGAFGGATIAREIAEALQEIPVLARYGDAVGIGVVVLGITLLSVVLGELVPKRLALNIRLLRVKRMPGDDHEAYQALSGFVLHQMQRIPREGDHFEWGGFRFEVADVDRHRLDKILIQPSKSAEPNQSPSLNGFIL
jgi:CBS domain containing-hemolysin-like protein